MRCHRGLSPQSFRSTPYPVNTGTCCNTKRYCAVVELSDCNTQHLWMKKDFWCSASALPSGLKAAEATPAVVGFGFAIIQSLDLMTCAVRPYPHYRLETGAKTC